MRASALLAALWALAALGAEQPLAFTVTGPTLATGTHEVLFAITPRFGRPGGFARFDSVAGFGAGLTSDLDLQLLVIANLQATGLDDRAAEGGLLARFRWQPFDARTDLLGASAVATVAVSPDSVFLEGRVTAERWLGAFLFALNVSGDFVIRRDGAAGADSHFEQSGGISYRLENGFSSGFEVRNRLGFDHTTWLGDAIYAGPVFGWRAKRWWVSFGAFAQVAAVKAPAVVGDGQPLELRDNEQFDLRLQLGFDVP